MVNRWRLRSFLRIYFLLTPPYCVSRLYSEKAYVLSRGFVRRALETPLGGLEAEINWLYNTQGRLSKVLDDSRALIQKSQLSPENAKADENLAVPRLTAGGIIMLERTLSKLQTILDQM
jgi:ubiquitin-conjugating enzyme E2 O